MTASSGGFGAVLIPNVDLGSLNPLARSETAIAASAVLLAGEGSDSPKPGRSGQTERTSAIPAAAG
jgi:hypothetical protein